MADVDPVMVTMTHPDVDDVAETTEEAYELHWKNKGWKRVTAPEAAKLMTKDDLVEVATNKGLDLSQAKTRADVAAVIEAAETKDPPA